MSEIPASGSSNSGRWVYWGAWIVAIGAVGMAVYLGWRVTSVQAIVPDIVSPAVTVEEPRDIEVSLPEFSEISELTGILPEIDPHTTIPTRPRDEVIDYTVDTGDSVFGIASAYGLKPETILWANYDTLNDNPDQISIGMQLKVPTEDGVLYLWQDGDTLQGVADRFEAKVEDILSWAGNQLDLTNPQVEPGTFVMVPGGHREFRQWIVPTIPRGRAGVSSSLYGAGTCEGGYDGAYGTGTFIWPADNHTLSDNDYWSGHLAIDIAAGEGAAISAADSGVVVFSGPAYGGYGNMIVIDHGNGYQTLYAHLNSVRAGCGQSVSQGQSIGFSGSTGNSTGAHLHFEVRYLGGFVSPWFVLPAP